MAEKTDKSDHKYRSLRNEFDELQLEKKAVFLIESGLSLFIHSIESLTHFVRDEVNKMADSVKDGSEEKEEEAEKKETTKKKTTTRKRSTSRSTSSKNKSSSKDDAASEEGDAPTT